MRFYLLFVLIPCAAYAVGSVSAAAVASSAWPAVRRRIAGRTPGDRARILATWRLAPAGAGAMLALVLGAAFARFEPRDTTEDPGLLLAAGAAVTLGLAAHALTRAGRAARAGIECARLVRVCGRPLIHSDGTPLWVVETDYPVAAVTGVVRTRLVVSTRILRECTPVEIDAVLEHERAHVRRRDNLVRAAMLALPNPLSLTRAGREMQAQWSAAAEESADDHAAGQAPGARTALASALVRVARMARTPAPAWMPGLAFYEGTNLERRVRRLLEPRGLATRMPPRAVAALALTVGAVGFALTEAAARQVHAWMEIAVHLVP